MSKIEYLKQLSSEDWDNLIQSLDFINSKYDLSLYGSMTILKEYDGFFNYYSKIEDEDESRGIVVSVQFTDFDMFSNYPQYVTQEKKFKYYNFMQSKFGAKYVDQLKQSFESKYNSQMEELQKKTTNLNNEHKQNLDLIKKFQSSDTYTKE